MLRAGSWRFLAPRKRNSAVSSSRLYGWAATAHGAAALRTRCSLRYGHCLPACTGPSAISTALRARRKCIMLSITVVAALPQTVARRTRACSEDGDG